jgi:hypothetical protein
MSNMLRGVYQMRETAVLRADSLQIMCQQMDL